MVIVIYIGPIQEKKNKNNESNNIMVRSVQVDYIHMGQYDF